MTIKRLYHLIRMAIIRGGGRRADYARKHHIYAHVGDGVSIQSCFIPIYSELISLGNNVIIARNVDFVTHDVIHVVLNNLPCDMKTHYHFKEQIGCIEVKDNVMIGSNSVILHGVCIGSNVIIGTGSVVTRDCEPDSVYAGVPAKKIGSFYDYMKRREMREKTGIISVTAHNQHLIDSEINLAWKQFYKNHEQQD